MNVLRPTKAIDRQTMASDSRTNDTMSSVPFASGAPGPEVVVLSSARSTGRHSTLPTTAGTTSSGENRSPPVDTTAATMRGATAKPILPPKENHPIALWLPLPASRATRADSGWYAATPIPDTAMNSRVSGYEPLRPLDATPSPPGSC